MIKNKVNTWFVGFLILLLVVIYQTSLMLNMSHILNSGNSRFTKMERDISDIKKISQPLEELSKALKGQEIDDIELIIE